MKLEVIIAPLVVFLFVLGLLIAARFYEHLPLKPPACGFKKYVGIPCVSCRGTRAMRSLSHGEFRQSFIYNPLVMIGCAISFFWIFGYVVRKGAPPRRQFSGKSITLITVGLLIANWIYLILTNHWYP